MERDGANDGDPGRRLLEDAARRTGITERSAVITAGLVALVERESARRMARLGGSAPDLEAPRRRRMAAGG
jgi:hypothetical protein